MNAEEPERVSSSDGGFSSAKMSIRISSIDHYMARIADHSSSPEFLHALQDAPESLRRNRLPVLRIFGPTPTGQKCCLHLHGILPYFYVPLPPGVPCEQATDCSRSLHAALEKLVALSFAGGSNPNQGHVLKDGNANPTTKSEPERFIFQVIPVVKRGIYGYQSNDTMFLKISTFNPAHISRLASMCSTGAIEDYGALQPFESHLSFPLQVLVDLNLTGMGFINLDDFKIRTSSSTCSGLTDADYGSGTNVDAQTQRDHVWKFPVPRRSSSEIEIDAFLCNVLNLDTGPGQKVVRTLGELWDEERKRRISRRLEQGASARDAEMSVKKEMERNDSVKRSKVAGRECTDEHFFDELRRLRQNQSQNVVHHTPQVSNPDPVVAPTAVFSSPKEVAQAWVQTYQAGSVGNETAPETLTCSDEQALLSKLLAAAGEKDGGSVVYLTSDDEDDEILDAEQIIADIHESTQAHDIPPDGATETPTCQKERKRRRISGEYAPLPLVEDDGSSPPEVHQPETKKSRPTQATSLEISPEQIHEVIIDEETRYSRNEEKSGLGKSLLENWPSSMKDMARKDHPHATEDSAFQRGQRNEDPQDVTVAIVSTATGGMKRDSPLGKNRRQSTGAASLPLPIYAKDAVKGGKADESFSANDKHSFRRESTESASPAPFDRPVVDVDVRLDQESTNKKMSMQNLRQKLSGKMLHRQPPPTRSYLTSTMKAFGICSVPSPVPYYGKPADAPKDPITFGGKVFKIPGGKPLGSPAAVMFMGTQDQSQVPVQIVTPARKPPPRVQLTRAGMGVQEKPVAVFETKLDSVGREIRQRVLVEKGTDVSNASSFRTQKDNTFQSLSLPQIAAISGRVSFQHDESSDDSIEIGSMSRSQGRREEVDESPTLTQRPASPKYNEGYQAVNLPRCQPNRATGNRLSFGKTLGAKGPLEEMSALNYQATKCAVATAPLPFRGLHENQGLVVAVLEIYAESRRQLLPDPRFDAVRFIVLKILGTRSGEMSETVVFQFSSDSIAHQLPVSDHINLITLVSEREMFDKCIRLLVEHDPDIVAGWEVQMTSIGYLIDRSKELDIDLTERLSRMQSNEFGKIRANDKPNVALQYIDRKLTAQPIIGRHIINIWRMARSEVKLPCYTLENISAEVLGKRIPLHDPETLTRWFSGSQRARTLGYIVQRAQTVADVIQKLDLVNRTSELARVYGLDFMSVLSRGSQFRVESIMARAAHSSGHILLAASREQVFKQPALECLPLVMEPESGYYSDPIVVLDFQSLYPSMIIAHNLCFSTMLGSVRVGSWDEKRVLGVLKDYQPPSLGSLSDEDIYVAPNGQAFITASKKRGILPQMLEEILDTRVMVKRSMKQRGTTPELKSLFNSRQFGLKMIANVTYGYASASFSGRMPCVALADAIVQSGHSALNHCVEVVEEKWKHSGARVVYGDTDSLFVRLPGASRKEAFQTGEEIAEHISSLYPTPIKLQFEKVYHPCLLVTKKRYVGYSYESVNQISATFDAKGIETVRRDSCDATRKILEQSIRLLFESNDLSIVKQRVQRQWRRILAGRVTMEDFIFRQEVRMGSYKDGSMPPAAVVASKQIDNDPRASPRHGARVEYVVVCGAPGAPLRQLVVSPQELLVGEQKGSMRLNSTYYITKQILPAMARLFSLLGADVRAWFAQMPRPYFEVVTGSSTKGTMHAFYLSSKCCLCGSWCSGIPKKTGGYVNVPLCESCAVDKQAAVYALSSKLRDKEDVKQRLTSLLNLKGHGGKIVRAMKPKKTSLTAQAATLSEVDIAGIPRLWYEAPCDGTSYPEEKRFFAGTNNETGGLGVSWLWSTKKQRWELHRGLWNHQHRDLLGYRVACELSVQ